MGTSALPDMYAQSPRAEGIHIRQSTSAHLQLIRYTSGTLKSAQHLTLIFSSVYIVTDSDYDCGS